MRSATGASIETTAHTISDSLKYLGYGFLPGNSVPVDRTTSDFQILASSWNNLPQDMWMPDGSQYRRRRFARFRLETATETLSLLPHEPFFQSVEINRFAGGISREFPPVEVEVCNNAALRRLIDFDRALLRRALACQARWEIKIHQIRIETSECVVAYPTPEGRHRDGHDFLAMHLIDCQNLDGGTTTLFDESNAVAFEQRLSDPLDSIVIDDQRMTHLVSCVQSKSAGRPGRRDILLVDFDRID